MIYQSSRGSGRFRTGREVLWPFQINMDSSEAEDLVACYVATPYGMVNLIDGTQGVRSGTADPLRGNDAGGLDASFDGTGDYYTFGADAVVGTGFAWTVVWEAELAAFSQANDFPCIGWFKSGTASNPFRVAYSNHASFTDLTWGSASTFNTGRASLSGVASVTGERHWGALVYNGAGAGTYTNYQPYVNGRALSVSDASAFGTVTDNNLVSGSTTDNEWNGGIRQVRVYRRAWTEAEAFAFYSPSTRDQLFAPRRRRIYLPAAPAAGADAAASAAGTSTATATGASIAASAATAAGTGSATATGAALVAAAAYSEGVATATAEGVEVTAGGTIASGSASSAGVSTAEAAGASIAEAAASSAGTSTARAVGADASAVATVRHEGVRRRRIVQQLRAIHEDDEELAMLIAAALPILQAKHGCGVRIR